MRNVLNSFKAIAIFLILVSNMPAQSNDGLAELRKEADRLGTEYKLLPKQVASDYSMALFRLGNALFQQKKYAEAKDALLKSDSVISNERKLNDNDAGNANLIGECCLRLKQFGEAEKYFEQAIKAAKANCDLNHEKMSIGLASAQLGLAESYDGLGKSDEAGAIYRDVAAKVDQMESGNAKKIASPESFDKLALYLQRKGNTKEAEQWWKRVSTMSVNAHAYGSFADALDHYAALLRTQGKEKEAAQLERQARDLRSTQGSLNKKGLDY